MFHVYRSAMISEDGIKNVLRFNPHLPAFDWPGFQQCMLARIAEMVQDQNTPKIIQELMQFKGKQMRAQLVWLAAGLLGSIAKEHIALACAIEYVHAASLLHDDVLDQGVLRRGTACTHRVHGNVRTILSGDWLLAQAFSVLLQVRNWDVVDCVQQAMKQLVIGQLVDCQFVHQTAHDLFGDFGDNPRPKSSTEGHPQDKKDFPGHQEGIYSRSFVPALDPDPKLQTMSECTRSNVADQDPPLKPSAADPSEADYLAMIRNKTAALFSVSAYAAALISKANPEQSQALKQYALDMGMVYQLQDDAAEYLAPAITWDAGHDFFQAKITYPWIAQKSQSAHQDWDELIQKHARLCQPPDGGKLDQRAGRFSEKKGPIHLDERRHEDLIWVHHFFQPGVEKAQALATVYAERARTVLLSHWKIQDVKPLLAWGDAMFVRDIVSDALLSDTAAGGLFTPFL